MVPRRGSTKEFRGVRPAASSGSRYVVDVSAVDRTCYVCIQCACETECTGFAPVYDSQHLRAELCSFVRTPVCTLHLSWTHVFVKTAYYEELTLVRYVRRAERGICPRAAGKQKLLVQATPIRNYIRYGGKQILGETPG